MDLSNVFFICTANDISQMPPPLVDRMDVVEMGSYSAKEKMHIFQKHIFPEAIEDKGLSEYKDKLVIEDGLAENLINNYCREPGVRSLIKFTGRILDSVGLDIVKQ